MPNHTAINSRCVELAHMSSSPDYVALPVSSSPSAESASSPHDAFTHEPTPSRSRRYLKAAACATATLLVGAGAGRLAAQRTASTPLLPPPLPAAPAPASELPVQPQSIGGLTFNPASAGHVHRPHSTVFVMSDAPDACLSMAAWQRHRTNPHNTTVLFLEIPEVLEAGAPAHYVTSISDADGGNRRATLSRFNETCQEDAGIRLDAVIDADGSWDRDTTLRYALHHGAHEVSGTTTSHPCEALQESIDISWSEFKPAVNVGPACRDYTADEANDPTYHGHNTN